MIFFVLTTAMIVFSSARAAKPGEFRQDYLSRENTAAVKGIFVILILFSHGVSYYPFKGTYDVPYIVLRDHLYQIVVAMFLFYSGYGMMEQISRRRWSYVRSVLLRRFPRLLLDFDAAVCLYLAANWALGKHITLRRFLLSLVAWDAIGNSNWYIFAMLCLYLLCFLAFVPLRFSAGKGTRYLCLIFLTALTLAFVYAQILFRRPRYTYDTVFLFVLGFWYSCFRERIEKFLMKNDIVYLLAGAVLTGAYIWFYARRSKGIEQFTAWACCFTALTVLLTMKVTFRSELLRWFGTHVFSIYVIQRLPMMVFHAMPFFEKRPYSFMILSIAATLPLALLLELLLDRLHSLIRRPREAEGELAEKQGG